MPTAYYECVVFDNQKPFGKGLTEVKNLGYMLRDLSRVESVCYFDGGISAKMDQGRRYFYSSYADPSVRESILTPLLEKRGIPISRREEKYSRIAPRKTTAPLALPKSAQSITLDEAKRLPIGATIYHLTRCNANGSAMRAKVLSVKIWKRSPARVLVSLKHGQYDYAKFDETEIGIWSLVAPDYKTN